MKLVLAQYPAKQINLQRLEFVEKCGCQPQHQQAKWLNQEEEGKEMVPLAAMVSGWTSEVVWRLVEAMGKLLVFG